jgi:hypothetical protein
MVDTIPESEMSFLVAYTKSGKRETGTLIRRRIRCQLQLLERRLGPTTHRYSTL